jgi:hypothetical protein
MTRRVFLFASVTSWKLCQNLPLIPTELLFTQASYISTCSSTQLCIRITWLMQ